MLKRVLMVSRSGVLNTANNERPALLSDHDGRVTFYKEN